MANQVFDGVSFLKDNGLQLVDVGNKEGVVKVQDSYGQQGEINLHQMMKSEGMNPAEFDLVYNTPDMPIQRSPVEWTDRLKLSLGNAKGQVGYLKNKFQDAHLTEDGDLVVKDKGAWYTVDPRGLGDGNGWDVAAEFAKDLSADLVGDATLITGQIAGGTLATAAALPSGPGAIAAGVAGSVGGAMAAKGAVTALGRIVGTYDATPEEQLKDVAIEGVLALGGEAVSLGAKHMILPAFKSAVKTLGNAAGGVKDVVTGILVEQAGAKPHNAARLLARPDAVVSHIDDLVSSVGKEASEEALLEASKKRSINSITPILSDAQKALSSEWRGRMGKIIAEVPDHIEMDVITPLSSALQEVGEAGFLKYSDEVGRYVPHTGRELAEKLGISEIEARPMAKMLGEWTNHVSRVLDGNKGILKGKGGVAELLEINKKLDDFYFGFIDGRQGLQEIITPISSKLRNGLLSTLPGETGKQVASLKSYYAHMKPLVQRAEKVMAGFDPSTGTGAAGVEGILNKLYGAGSDEVALRTDLAALAQLKKGGTAALEVLNDQLAAHDFVRMMPKGAVLGAGGKINVGLVPPRAIAKGVSLGVKAQASFNKMVRGLGPRNRTSLLQSPEILGAAVTEVIRTGRGQ